MFDENLASAVFLVSVIHEVTCDRHVVCHFCRGAVPRAPWTGGLRSLCALKRPHRRCSERCVRVIGLTDWSRMARKARLALHR